MKSHQYFSRFAPVLAILLLASVTAFAKKTRRLTLNYPATLGGTQLAAGKYKVSWESTGPEVTLTIARRKNVVAIARGKWVERPDESACDMVLYEAKPNGPRTVVEIGFTGLRQSIVFDESSSSLQNSSRQTDSSSTTSAHAAPSGDTAQRMRFLGKPRFKPRASSEDLAGILRHKILWADRLPLRPGEVESREDRRRVH